LQAIRSIQQVWIPAFAGMTGRPLKNPMKLLLIACSWLALYLSAFAQPTKDLATITITSGRPTSLPSQIPTTMEGIRAEQIAQSINATDSEDALKYLPSLLIRKRFIGDYNHAVLASRASGTNNSARSVVYADGILLSNFLGNGAAYAPRWGMVTPEEIERVDVLYGPFSAAYPGNSVGAIVDYQTKMPTAYEAHGKLSYSQSPFHLYGTNESNKATQISASVGNKNGDWSWWLNANRTTSKSQPLAFVTKTPAACVGACTGTAVNGAVLSTSTTNAPLAILGTTTSYDSVQDYLKAKVAFDITPTLKASYTVGYWHNDSQGRPQSYLTNAASGAAVTSGSVNSGGYNYTIGTNDFGMSNEALTHFMHGFSLKSNTKSTFDYEVALSQFRYAADEARRPNSYALGQSNGAGVLTDQRGTGWDALALKGTYRPDGLKGAHILDFGYQRDAYKLSILNHAVAAWTGSAAATFVSDVGGNTRLESLWGQDTWRIAKDWKAVLGLRSESWTASNGHTVSSALNTPYAARTESALSPKAALAFQAAQDVALKASIGRAVRFPTVQELYGSTNTALAQFVNDPNLRPEKSVTSEWSVEKDTGSGLLRGTLFFEGTRDSLYSQSTLVGATTVTRVQNVGRIQTRGLEVSYQAENVLQGTVGKGFDFSSSLTYAESKIRENAGFVVTAGDTIGSYQPRVPLLRATAMAAYRWSDKLSTSLGMRYSGKQYNSLNNADVNGFAYTGVSKFFVVDTRVRYQWDKATTLAFGIDNLNNYQYWNFHPYPQRTYHAELRIDWK
jgi:iron complex outermembrane recepter protein